MACRGKRLLHESVTAKAHESVTAKAIVTTKAHESVTKAVDVAPSQASRARQPPPFSSPQLGKTKPEHPPEHPSVKTSSASQLNILNQIHKPEFYEAVAKIMDIRQQYIQDRFVFVKSRDMVPLVLGLGAKQHDMARLQLVSDNLRGDPTLPFRRTRNGRFCIDFDTNTLRRLEFQPFTLTVQEDFKRYDSGNIRRFDEVQDELQLNSVFQALFVFKAMVLHGISIARRLKLQYDSNKWVCTLFSTRTFTNSDILGEPALEGVHSDGVDHTMTSFLGSSNMAPNSAATFLHDMAESTGIRLAETSPHHLLSRVQHRNFLDTLVVIDHERKHSLSPVYSIDKSKEARRDMLVFFTRKPVEKTHVSGSMDSLTPHPDMPMEIPIFAPRSH